MCIKFPWPSMARSIHGNHKRFKEVYFKKFKKHYFSGDGCYRDEKGMYRITGRKDDIIIVSGHNLEQQRLKIVSISTQEFLKQL